MAHQSTLFLRCYGPELTSGAILKWAGDNDVDWYYIDAGKPQQNGFTQAPIAACACRLMDELLNDEIFATLDNARQKLALWRYDDNNVRPHSSLGARTPAEAHRAIEHSEWARHDVLAQNIATDYEIRTRKRSL